MEQNQADLLETEQTQQEEQSPLSITQLKQISQISGLDKKQPLQLVICELVKLREEEETALLQGVTSIHQLLTQGASEVRKLIKCGGVPHLLKLCQTSRCQSIQQITLQCIQLVCSDPEYTLSIFHGKGVQILSDLLSRSDKLEIIRLLLSLLGGMCEDMSEKQKEAVFKAMKKLLYSQEHIFFKVEEKGQVLSYYKAVCEVAEKLEQKRQRKVISALISQVLKRCYFIFDGQSFVENCKLAEFVIIKLLAHASRGEQSKIFNLVRLVVSATKFVTFDSHSAQEGHLISILSILSSDIQPGKSVLSKLSHQILRYFISLLLSNNKAIRQQSFTFILRQMKTVSVQYYLQQLEDELLECFGQSYETDLQVVCIVTAVSINGKSSVGSQDSKNMFTSAFKFIRDTSPMEVKMQLLDFICQSTQNLMKELFDKACSRCASREEIERDMSDGLEEIGSELEEGQSEGEVMSMRISQNGFVSEKAQYILNMFHNSQTRAYIIKAFVNKYIV